MALIHHPVVNKNGEIITSAVTNIDLHDIARAGRTYGVSGYYVVTPLSDQQALSQKLISHWTSGYGATYNADRKEALSLIRICSTLESAMDEIREETGMSPKQVVTGAKAREKSLSFEAFRRMLSGEDGPAAYLLLLGTAWGLAESVKDSADFALAPVKGPGEYNHLSVRSAASIILDRLAGDRQPEKERTAKQIE